MAHVELSLSEAFVPPGAVPCRARRRRSATQRRRAWAADGGRTPVEPCLVIDAATRIVAVSAVLPASLLGLGEPANAAGQHLLGRRAPRWSTSPPPASELTEAEIEKIPPLLALASGGWPAG